MLLKKERRIKLLGFDDLWFIIIGILILSLITDYLFNNSFANYPFRIAIIQWSFSLLFSIMNWFIMRGVMISLRKKYPLFQNNIKRIVLVFAAMICTVLFVDFLGNLIIKAVFNDQFTPLSSIRVLIPVLLISTMILSIYEAMYFYVRLKEYIRNEEQAKQAVVTAKLDALRNQAQPHFLFNSLNTLRDIIDQDTKEDAKSFVDKLSDVYRFILDSGSSNLIPLKEELDFAKSYIHIQKERFGDNLILNWNISTEEENLMLVPMSLQLLLENAIKHNVVSRTKPLVVNVTSENHRLIVENKIEAKSTKIASTKLGLKNIIKRYALLTKKDVVVKDDGLQFKVSIPLLIRET